MKIWEVTENDSALRLFWYATKKEATAHARTYNKERDNNASLPAEIRAVKVTPTRAGIAAAMNSVINMTCFNEG